MVSRARKVIFNWSPIIPNIYCKVVQSPVYYNTCLRSDNEFKTISLLRVMVYSNGDQQSTVWWMKGFFANLPYTIFLTILCLVQYFYQFQNFFDKLLISTKVLYKINFRNFPLYFCTYMSFHFEFPATCRTKKKKI